MHRTLRLLPLFLLASLGLLHFPPLTALATDSPVQLSVINEDFATSDLVDPTFTPGSSFNITITASNIPAIDQASGGLSGFDISLNYNHSIIKASRVGFDAPFCPSSDGCIFDMPSNDTITVASSMDAQPGVARLAMIAMGPSHRAVLPVLQGEPAILFRIEFDVVGKGLTTISIDPESQLLGFTSGCGNLVSYTVVNGSFDNREPFRVSATPLSPTVALGGSVTMLANVSLVNSVGNGNISLTLSGIIPIGDIPEFTFKFSPSFGILNGPANAYSFTSNLQISAASQTPQGSYPLTIAGVIPSPAANAFQYNYNFTLTVSSGYYATQVHSPAYSQSSEMPPSSAAASPTSSSASLLAIFTLSPTPSLGRPVTFTAVGVWCSSPPYTLRWDFGDKSSGTSNPATHVYNASGTFTVTLTVTKSNGASYSSSQSFTISSPPSNVASLDVSVISGGIILALVLIGTFLLLRRRRRPLR